jgi:hypothetical protein
MTRFTAFRLYEGERPAGRLVGMTVDERLEAGLEHMHAKVVHPSTKRERMPRAAGQAWRTG